MKIIQHATMKLCQNIPDNYFVGGTQAWNIRPRDKKKQKLKNQKSQMSK